METIAVISDIHANVLALDSILKEVERIEPDHVVCLGDVAATGPAPREVVARLRGKSWSFVRGNCDDNILSYARGDDRPVVDAHDEIDRWCAQLLSAEDLAFIATFQPYIALNAGEIDLCFYHGSPKSNLDEIMPDTAESDLERWFLGYQAQIFGGGHTHVQMMRRYREAYVINPGSVGLPFTFSVAGHLDRPSWAEFGLVRVDGPNIAVELRRTAVDLSRTIADAAERGMPGLAWWSGELE